MQTPWIEICGSDEIPAGGAKLVRIEKTAVALWRTESGTLHGVDNRCPHEGYPMVKGDLRDCALTCTWHNYKFDVRDGRCLVGEEDLRVFPMLEESGRVWLDPTPPDPELERQKLWASFEEGAVEGDMGRAARDMTRLLELDVSPVRLLQEIAALDADRGKWGVTHVLAVCADLRERMRRHPDEHPLLPMLHAVELFAEGSRRRPKQESTAPAAKTDGESEERLRERFLSAVENEDLQTSSALLALALEELAFESIQEWLLLAAASHFHGFGHSLIYATKWGEVVADAPAELRARVAQGLLRQIVYATREDMLPPMAGVREHLERNREARERWAMAAGSRRLSAAEREELVREILEGDATGMCAHIDAHLEAGVAPDSLCDVLVHAAAERLWRFDPAIHDDMSVQDGWLHVSHPFTFAHATRETLARLPHAISLGALYHVAHFIQRGKKLDGPRQQLPEAVVNCPLDAEALAAALRAGDPDAALRIAATAASVPAQREELWDAVDALVLADVATRPIYIAHVLKTTRVAFEEAALAGEPASSLGLFALLRFLATPKIERPLRMQANDARNLVENGKLPRLLSA